jgi:drug/metabolite transporter (DMT)-like permease
MSPYISALLSNFAWGFGTQFYTLYSKKLSPLWTNIFKGTLGCILFGFTVIFTGGFAPIQPAAMALFLLSGFIGLGIADIFLFKSFTLIGSSRTIMIVSFETGIIGVLSYFFFGQRLDGAKLFSIIFLVGCIFIFALEGYKKTSKWQPAFMVPALIGILFESAGIIATRMAFNISDAAPMQANVYRCMGAVLCFIIVARLFKVRFFAVLRRMPVKAAVIITCASFVGTYLSLLFHLYALKSGHLATISAMACTGVVFAALFECLFEKKRPSKYLLAAFGLFLCAMGLIFR